MEKNVCALKRAPGIIPIYLWEALEFYAETIKVPQIVH